MKRRCLTALLLCGVGFAISPQWVKFKSSLTNENGVKFIVVQGKDAHPSYTLGCNDGEKDCVTPDIGVWYLLRSSPEGKYTNRENVALVLNGQVIGSYYLLASAE